MANDKGFPSIPEGKENNIKIKLTGPSADKISARNTGRSTAADPALNNLPVKKLTAKLLTTQSNLEKKNRQINKIKSKSARELENFRARFKAQKSRIKKELNTYKTRLAREKQEWNKLVAEKEAEVRRIREALTGKDKIVNEKVLEAEAGIKNKLNRQHALMAEEKKILEKKNAGLETRLKEIEGGWKRKEQEVKDLQEKALKELKGAEERLQEEREKTWLKTLRAKEDEINSLKVEVNLQESRLRMVLEKKQAELKELEEKAGRTLRERLELINGEKTGILEALAGKEKEIVTLKESYLDREKYLIIKVEEVELDGKLALARFEQELKEREKKLWVEREEWLTVLKSQFKEKEKDLKDSVEKEKAVLKERESAFVREREKMLFLLSAKDGELKLLNTELKKILENREPEMEALRRELKEASKVKETELDNIRKEYIRVIEGREKELEKIKAELKAVLASRADELAAARAEARNFIEAKEKENAQLSRAVLDKEAEHKRRISEFEARAAEAARKVVDNEELWKQRIALKEAELADMKGDLLRRETAFKEALETKKRELEEAREIFLREKENLAEKIALKDYEFAGEVAKKEQEVAALAEKTKRKEEEWTSGLEGQKRQFYAKLSEQDEASFKHMEENRVLLLKLKAEEDALVRKEQEYRLFISQFEEKERQFKKLLEEQVRVIRKLEEDMSAESSRNRDRIKALENSLIEKDTASRRLESELNAKQNIIAEREYKLSEFERGLKRLEQDKLMLQEELERSRSEIARVKEGVSLEYSGLKTDLEKLQRELGEKNSAIESLRSSLSRLNEENAKTLREYELERGHKAQLSAELERLRAELETLKNDPASGVAVQLGDKEIIIRSLNDTISKLEKEKAAMKDLILEKSETEEARNKELKELMETVSNLSEEKNKFDFKVSEIASERETALQELTAAQSEIERLRNDAGGLKQAYESSLEKERRNLESALEKVTTGTEDLKRVSSASFEQEKKTLLEEVNRLKTEIINAGNVLDAFKIESRMKLQEQRAAFEAELKKKDELLLLGGPEQRRRLEEELDIRVREKEDISRAYEERLAQLKEEIEKRDRELARVKEDMDADLSGHEEQNRKIEELKKEVALAGNELRAAKEEALQAAGQLKNKEAENQKLQMELGGLITRTEEISRISEENTSRIFSAKTDLEGKVAALAEALKLKEKDLETARAASQELERRIANDYVMKEEELKLAIGRLQMQVKDINNRYDTEIKAEKQKVQALQAEYVLREVQWTSQKDKEKEIKGQMADMEATIASLKKDSETGRKQFQDKLENSAANIKELEEKVRRLDADNSTLSARAAKETLEKENLLKQQSEIDKKLKDLLVSLHVLRRRFKYILWLWYPNEPRN